MDDFWGLVMSRPNTKINKITSLKDFDFHSDYPLLKIAFANKGIVNGTITDEWSGSGEASYTFNHNLGYVPRVIAAVSLEGGWTLNDIDNYVKLPYSAGASAGFWGDWITMNITTTSLTISASGNGWTDPVRMGYAYYIFYDEQ